MNVLKHIHKKFGGASIFISNLKCVIQYRKFINTYFNTLLMDPFYSLYVIHHCYVN